MWREVNIDNHNRDLITWGRSHWSQLLVGILKCWFWWIAWGWVWTSWRVENSWGTNLGGRPTFSRVLPPGTTPPPGSQSEVQRKIPCCVQEDGKHNHFEIHPVFSITKACPPREITLPEPFLTWGRSWASVVPSNLSVSPNGRRKKLRSASEDHSPGTHEKPREQEEWSKIFKVLKERGKN